MQQKTKQQQQLFLQNMLNDSAVVRVHVYTQSEKRNTLMTDTQQQFNCHTNPDTKCLIIMVEDESKTLYPIRARTKRFNRTKSNETMIKQNFQWL